MSNCGLLFVVTFEQHADANGADEHGLTMQDRVIAVDGLTMQEGQNQGESVS